MAATLNINGKDVAVDAAPDTPLLWVLRDELQLTGTKYGCGIAQCGACTVHLNGQAMRSCQVADRHAGRGQDHHHRGPGRRPSGAGGVDQARRAAMRLLPVGPDHERRGAAGAGPPAHRRRHRPGDERQHLPLRHLPAHPRGDQGRRRRGHGLEERQMNALVKDAVAQPPRDRRQRGRGRRRACWSAARPADVLSIGAAEARLRRVRPVHPHRSGRLGDGGQQAHRVRPGHRTRAWRPSSPRRWTPTGTG